jgi:hypothetical protein
MCGFYTKFPHSSGGPWGGPCDVEPRHALALQIQLSDKRRAHSGFRGRPQGSPLHYFVWHKHNHQTKSHNKHK